VKTTIWRRNRIVIYIGGDPAKGQNPELTIELENPQVLIDSESNIITIVETK
jgi:hypothetical protein